jgi:hypothetical protein
MAEVMSGCEDDKKNRGAGHELSENNDTTIFILHYEVRQQAAHVAKHHYHRFTQGCTKLPQFYELYSI